MYVNKQLIMECLGFKVAMLAFSAQKAKMVHNHYATKVSCNIYLNK